VIDWLTFYNHTRVRSPLGHVGSMQYEKNLHAAQLLKVAEMNRLRGTREEHRVRDKMRQCRVERFAK
jgi:hypothetical protein